MTVEELLYGDIAEYRATRDHRAGEIVRVDSRFGVVHSDLHKGDLAEVICSDPFVYECSTEYSVCEGDPVYFDLKRQTFVPAGTHAAQKSSEPLRSLAFAVTNSVSFRSMACETKRRSFVRRFVRPIW